MPMHFTPIKKIIIGVTCLIPAFVISLYIFKHQIPVLYKVSIGDCSCNPEKAICNPFRDKTPELIANNLLISIKSKNTSPLFSIVPSEKIDHIIQRENEFPFESWVLGDRKDVADRIYLTYWVNRVCKDSHHHQEVFIGLTHSSRWSISSYSAIY